MYTIEILKETVPNLTEEQCTKILELSANTEKIEIEKLKTDISVQEIAKIAALKTEFEVEKNKLIENSKNSPEIEKLKNEISELKRGAGDIFNQKLRDLETQLKNKNDAFETLKTEKETEFKNIKIESEKAILKHKILSNLPEIDTKLPEQIIKLTKKAAVEELLKFARLSEDGETVIVTDENGNVRANKANANSPYSISEFAKENEYLKPILKTGNQATGQGIKNTKKTANIQNIDYTGKTKEQIADELSAQGLSGTELSKAYSEAVKQLN